MEVDDFVFCYVSVVGFILEDFVDVLEVLVSFLFLESEMDKILSLYFMFKDCIEKVCVV